MAFFGKGAKFQSVPRNRHIPTLNPAYFEQLRTAMAARGSEEPLDRVAVGVANAVFNVGCRLFDATNSYTAKDFRKTFTDVEAIGPDCADHMINYIVIRGEEFQQPLETLLNRLLITL